MNRTVGEILRDAREAQGLTLQEAARATHIGLHYLQEIENDHPELLPSKAQARGFLRLYASYLNLDPGMLLELWNPQKESVPEKPKEQVEEHKPDERKEASSDKSEKKAKRKGLRNLFQQKRNEDADKEPEFAEEEKDAEENVEEGIEAVSQDVKRTSQAIFREVADQMRSRREKLGLTLSDVEQFTRLRRLYIQAIEDARFDDLPSSVQGRGMVNNYARFLELDQDAVMALYAEGLEAQRVENLDQKWQPREPAIKVNIRLPESLRRILSPDLVFGSLVVIALFAFLFWGATQIFGGDVNAEPTEAPSISEMLQTTVTPTSQQTPEETDSIEQAQVLESPATEEPAQQPTTIATINAAPLQLYIIATDRAWMRITVDGVLEFEGRIVPGNAYTFSGDDRILLTCGNAAALEVYFNQEFAGELGVVGQVINLDFSIDGLSVPTPTITSTPTPTLTPLPTDEMDMMDGLNP